MDIDRQTDRQTQGHSKECASIASHGKNITYNICKQ